MTEAIIVFGGDAIRYNIPTSYSINRIGVFFVMDYNRKTRFASGHDDGCEHTEKVQVF